MSDYSTQGVKLVDIPQHSLDEVGGGTRRWRLRSGRTLCAKSKDLLRDIAVGLSTDEIQFSWPSLEGRLELVVTSRVHPGSDPAMLATRQVLSRAVDRLPERVVEIEGTGVGVWRTAGWILPSDASPIPPLPDN